MSALLYIRYNGDDRVLHVKGVALTYVDLSINICNHQIDAMKNLAKILTVDEDHRIQHSHPLACKSLKSNASNIFIQTAEKWGPPVPTPLKSMGCNNE